MKCFGLGCWWVLIMACSPKPGGGAQLTAANTQQIRDLVHAAQTKADAYATARERGLREAWRTLDPAAATAPCPVRLPKLPLFHGWDDVSPSDHEALDVAHWRMTVVAGTAVLGEPPPGDEKAMQKLERRVATMGRAAISSSARARCCCGSRATPGCPRCSRTRPT